jgi:hypothetical protein
MNLNLRSFIICLLCLAHPVLVFSASELTFNSSARPATLVLGDVDFWPPTLRRGLTFAIPMART